MDALAEKYQDEVKFLLVYGYEAHAEDARVAGGFGLDQMPALDTKDSEERRSLARSFRATYQIQRQVMVDNFEEQSAACRLLGTVHFAHPLVVLDVEGKLALYMSLADVRGLDEALERLMATGGHYVHPDTSNRMRK
jgi:hypothetical protein